jgi:hypothetical protein
MYIIIYELYMDGFAAACLFELQGYFVEGFGPLIPPCRLAVSIPFNFGFHRIFPLDQNSASSKPNVVPINPHSTSQ